MKVKVQQLEVTSQDPFASDRLGRKQEIENLTPLLRNVDTPMVLSVNGRWGTGKSTFINMWSRYLENNDFHVLSFNAWTSDFSEDPLLAFLGEMNAQLVDEGEGNSNWEECKRIGGLVAKRAIPALIRIGTAGVVNFGDDINGELKNLVGSLAEDAVKEYETTRTNIAKFKHLLGHVVDELRSDLPLVIFVDELDRCRPTYAIELLERIKHLFDQKEIVFVLAMDREQLCHSISAVYGGIDAVGYLRRFIDLEYTLAIPSREAYLRNLIDTWGIKGFLGQRVTNARNEMNGNVLLVEVFLRLMMIYELSLREVEQLLARINLAFYATPTSESIPVPLVVYLVVVREREPDTYLQFKQEKLPVREIVNQLRDLKESVESNPQYRSLNYPLALVEGCILAAVGKVSARESILEAHDSIVSSRTHSNHELSYSRDVLNSFNEQPDISLRNIVARIDLASALQFDTPSS